MPEKCQLCGHAVHHSANTVGSCCGVRYMDLENGLVDLNKPVVWLVCTCVYQGVPKSLRVDYKVGTMGVGMPAALHLNEFGSQIWSAFGEMPFLVGSALSGKNWRDVDVRLILADDEYTKMFPDLQIGQEHLDGKWVALCMAFSALGKQMTGLPIDFQVQQRTAANTEFPGNRSAIGAVPLRFRERKET